MSRTPFSLKSAHLLMWSSPILLLVLVFTLTATSPRGHAASSPPPSSTSPVTTQVPVSTTSTIATSTPSTPVIVAAKTTKTTRTTSSVARNYSDATTSSVKPVAPISNANAMSGELSGTLAPGIESVDVPLLGPGNWTLSTSAATDQSLSCGSDASPVVNQVVVGSGQSCQLEITSTSTGTSTWQLTPNT